MNKKILIVDDEPDVAIYFESLFQDNGYRTVVAYDGVAGLKLARSEKPDLITLDITMPVHSGVTTYGHYKSDARLINIPVIVITAIDESMKDFLEKLTGLPEPEGFISKPIDPEKLLDLISQILNAGTSEQP